MAVIHLTFPATESLLCLPIRRYQNSLVHYPWALLPHLCHISYSDMMASHSKFRLGSPLIYNISCKISGSLLPSLLTSISTFCSSLMFVPPLPRVAVPRRQPRVPIELQIACMDPHDLLFTFEDHLVHSVVNHSWRAVVLPTVFKTLYIKASIRPEDPSLRRAFLRHFIQLANSTYDHIRPLVHHLVFCGPSSQDHTMAGVEGVFLTRPTLCPFVFAHFMEIFPEVTFDCVLPFYLQN